MVLAQFLDFFFGGRNSCILTWLWNTSLSLTSLQSWPAKTPHNPFLNVSLIISFVFTCNPLCSPLYSPSRKPTTSCWTIHGSSQLFSYTQPHQTYLKQRSRSQCLDLFPPSKCHPLIVVFWIFQALSCTIWAHPSHGQHNCLKLLAFSLVLLPCWIIFLPYENWFSTCAYF